MCSLCFHFLFFLTLVFPASGASSTSIASPSALTSRRSSSSVAPLLLSGIAWFSSCEVSGCRYFWDKYVLCVGIDWVETRVRCKCVLRVFIIFPYDLSYCDFDFVLRWFYHGLVVVSRSFVCCFSLVCFCSYLSLFLISFGLTLLLSFLLAVLWFGGSVSFLCGGKMALFNKGNI